MAANLDLAIRGDTVATASDSVRSYVGIRDGRVVRLAASITRAAREIEADGLLVMPRGVDAHCHLAQPTYGGGAYADDFETGTRSALTGGTTTLLSFATQITREPLRETVSAYRASAENKAMIDYGIHLIVTDTSPQVLGQDLPSLIRNGYTSFKLFMTYDEYTIENK